MERMEYDPEGGNYQPVTEHETGATFMVVGLIMLIAALGWMLFVGWDVRAGGGLMQAIFCGGRCPGAVPHHPGIHQKKRQTI